MSVVNRCVVIVKVKEPFRDWLQSLPDPTDITTDEINEDNSVYLLPEYEDDTDIFAILEHFYDLIFEEQLNNWWTDESCWPSNRDFDTFVEWFGCKFHSLVMDLVDEPLVNDDE